MHNSYDSIVFLHAEVYNVILHTYTLTYVVRCIYRARFKVESPQFFFFCEVLAFAREKRDRSITFRFAIVFFDLKYVSLTISIKPIVVVVAVVILY